MASQFSSEVLKVCVGQVCQAIGYQGLYSTPLEVLTHLLHRYLSELCRLTHRYTEHFGRTEPTLDDLGLAFMDMGISVPELEEYISNVDCPPFPHPLPELPVARPSNLNFLKPGAREILSRPIHIHEHLPPMYPEKEEEEVDVKVGGGLDDGGAEGASPSISPQPALKRPADSDVSPTKKPKFSMDDEGQPVREIVSVMMTTSGFISSAREGKLPEARCPDIPLATPRSTSPSIVGKKKLTVEKLIRQKNSQVGGGAARGGLARPPRPNKIKTSKDRVIGKGLKIPKLPSRPLSLPKGVPPGSSPLPPKLKMPLLKPPTPKPPTPKPSTPKPPTPKPPTPKPPKIPSPKPAIPPKVTSAPKASPPKPAPSPCPQPPKSSAPKIKVPKPPRPPKAEGKKPGTGQVKTEKGEKEGEAVSVSKKVKKEKEGSKKEGKKEGSKKEGSKKEGSKKEARKDKEGRKEGSKKETKKEKEIKKEKERERELIIALASSSAVTVTSIPAPSKPLDAPAPPGPEKAEGKSKLSIFKKINKAKDVREEREAPAPPHAPTSAPAQPSRDSSPDLMIDETPGRGQRRPPEEPPPEVPPVRGETAPEEVGPRSPVDYPPYQEDLSPPTTPSTPRTPEIPQHLPPHRSPEKRRGRDKGRERRPRKDRSKSPKGGPFSPGPREAGDPEPPDRPKTPEGGLPIEEMGVGPGSPFLPAFPTAPGFIPPFSRFPFLPPFGGPPPRPGMAPPIPDLRLPPHHHFLPRPPLKRPLEEDSLCPVEDNEPLERPPTPRHPRESSPLIMRGHSSPMRSPSPSTPPRPRTPAHHSPPPQVPPRPHPRPDKPEKTDKEKKKEHKREKKEKEKEKEKVKKKKDKKDKEKEKDKSDKKKEKEKTKQEKKEKKVKREKEEGAGGPKITMKLASSMAGSSSSSPDAQPPITPKLVIKPIVKHDDKPPPLPPQPPPLPPPKTQDDQPGSPEIAKISALITRPPRSSQQKRAESPPALAVLKIKDVPNPVVKHKEGKEASHTPAKVKEVPPLKIKNPTSAPNKAPSSSKVAPPAVKQSMTKLPTSPKATIATCPKPPTVSKVIEEKKPPVIKKPREKKEKKEKRMKDLPVPTSNPLVGSLSKPGPTAGGSSEASYSAHSPLPIVSPPLDTPRPSKKQEQKSTGLLTETVGPIGHFVDDQGNEVWICPTCGKQDDGSPMIGCDTCDDWYHWVCVGIQVPPNDDVNWYCPRCLSQHKQRGIPPEKKKRGRKKK